MPIGSYIYNPAVERILEDTGEEVGTWVQINGICRDRHSMMAIFMSERQS